MADLLVIILFIALAVLSFLFSMSETAIIALSKIRLRHMLAQGIKGAQSIQNLVSKIDKFIATILIGNNFVNIAMSAIVTALCIPLFGPKWGTLVATFATAFFVLVFCEITPKILATKNTEKTSLFIAPVMALFVKA